MMLPNKIVRRTWTSGEPVKIGVSKQKKNEEISNEDAELDEDGTREEELRLKEREDEVNRLLADIDQREKSLAERFISLQKDEKKVKELKQRTQAECDRILMDAKAEAEKMYNEAKTTGHEEGFNLGHEEGFEKGEKDAEQQWQEIIADANEKAQKTLRDAKDLTADYFIRAEDDVAKILMIAIEKILPQHFIDVPKDVLPVVREAIQYVRDQKEVNVHVEPHSYDLVLAARGELQALLTDGTAILEITSDDALNPGDCVIETPNGGVDARLSGQIEIVKDAIKSMMIM